MWKRKCSQCIQNGVRLIILKLIKYEKPHGGETRRDNLIEALTTQSTFGRSSFTKAFNNLQEKLES